MAIDAQQLAAFIFGILGNLVSFLVYLSPLPTFIKIYKRQSTEGYHSFPYSVALFSAMLYLYYARLKHENGIIILTINSVGLVIESAYLVTYMIYATPASRILTAKIFLVFNLGLYALVVLITSFAFEGENHIKAAGWACAVFSVIVFISPLSIMRKVIRTKSVKYMPLGLSVALTGCAVVWFFYGFLINDYFIAFPNILGFLFSIAQIILYACYRKNSGQNAEQELSDVSLSVMNEEEPPVDANKSVSSTGGDIDTKPGYNVLVENSGDNGNEIQEIETVIIKVVVDNKMVGEIEEISD